MTLPFPAGRRSKEEVLAEMRAARDHDVRWRSGRVFGLIYHAGDEIEDLLQEAFTLFFAENGLNPAAFPSLRKFETEVVAMSASLLGGDDQVAGTMTSGGTESLLLAVKTARDWARAHRPETLREAPEMVVPLTGHPALDKAAHYFGVKAVHVPVGDDFRAVPDAMAAAITPNTILMVGSAPSYPQGVVDPIPELAAIAQAKGLLFHVDACVGGFILPFARALGHPVPEFDFRVPGVTSLSADLHKYGYAAKGASVILYRTRELRRFQFFIYTDWPGGIYPSPALSGTRPGGPIAAAWAILNHLGWEGYLEITGRVLEATKKLQEGIAAIPGIRVLGKPVASVFAIGSDGVDIYEVADELALRGWYFDRQHFPASLHVTVSCAHVAVVDAFLADLASSVAAVRKPSLRKAGNKLVVRGANAAVRLLPERWVSALMKRASGLVGAPSRWSGVGSGGGGLPGRTAPMYGMIGTLPNRGDLRELVTDLIDGMTCYQAPETNPLTRER
ncbi:MAG TPA: aspartate aminotransferase family protein, partial [Anaerolineae bacterium]|nr:aspartate aminotransferase family protein [Anaerolineae bacterium]